jgi:hypothetical protein
VAVGVAYPVVVGAGGEPRAAAGTADPLTRASAAAGADSNDRAPEPGASASATSEAGIAGAPLRVALVGDSLSAGASGFLGNGLDRNSWMTYANGSGIDFVGGWAKAGATPDQMAASATPVGDVDVLVILAGTNAVRDGKSFSDEAWAYESIVRTMGAQHVLIAAIPPYEAHARAATAYNTALRAFAAKRGWDWTDPWSWARDGERWTAGVSADGMHPAGATGYQSLGTAIRSVVLQDYATPGNTAAGR